MATRAVREFRDELRRPFLLLVAVNALAALVIVLCIYAFLSMVH